MINFLIIRKLEFQSKLKIACLPAGREIQNSRKVMKLSTKQYAQALYELTKDKPENEASVVIEKYVANLKQQGLLNKVEDIIKKFTEIYNKKNGIIKAKIFTGRELNRDTLDSVSSALIKKYNSEKIETKVKVDKSLRGGIKIIVGEDIIDNSILGRLQKLKQVIG